MNTKLIDFNPQWMKMNHDKSYKYELRGEPEFIWYMTQVLIGEIDNSGFVGFFVNGYASQKEDFIYALNELNCNQVINIIEKACNLFPENFFPSTQNEIENYWNSTLCNDKHTYNVNKVIDECDKSFYEYEEIIEYNLVNYIIKNKLNEKYL